MKTTNPARIRFDLITAISLIGGGAWWLSALYSDVQTLKSDVAEIKSDVKKVIQSSRRPEASLERPWESPSLLPPGETLTGILSEKNPKNAAD